MDALVAAAATNPAITDREALRRAVYERESILSTGVGAGLAIPHVRMSEVLTPVLGVALAPKGLDFAAADQQPVYVIVLFATPKGADKEYLRLLAQVILSLRNEEFYARLASCEEAGQAYALLNT